MVIFWWFTEIIESNIENNIAQRTLFSRFCKFYVYLVLYTIKLKLFSKSQKLSAKSKFFLATLLPHYIAFSTYSPYTHILGSDVTLNSLGSLTSLDAGLCAQVQTSTLIVVPIFIWRNSHPFKKEHLEHLELEHFAKLFFL